MQDRMNYKDIEFALHVLQHPERLCDPDVVAWLETKEHRDLLEEFRRYWEAGMREKGESNLDEDYQLWLLDRRIASLKRKKQNYWKIKVAAMVVVLLSVSVFIYYQQEKIQPVRSIEISQEIGVDAVMLITEEGKEYVLSSDTSVANTLHKNGLVIDSMGGLKYVRIVRDTNRSEEYHTIRVPRGGEYILILDDGTRVWINSESELRYPVTFCGSERKVYLKGEAYFEVKSDEERPFVVMANQLDIRVLGTEFNVQSYSDEVQNVTLVKGSVVLKKESAEFGEVLLKPGENASLRGDQIHVEMVDVLKYISWREGFFYYNNVRLEEIMDELGRWFDFSVFYRNAETKDFRFKFWANRKDSVKQVIERLNETGKVKIDISGKTVFVSL